jgi:hypothetical protein
MGRDVGALLPPLATFCASLWLARLESFLSFNSVQFFASQSSLVPFSSVQPNSVRELRERVASDDTT